MDEKTRALIHRKWRKAFEEFVETGEASQAFHNYLDSDPNAQRAVETVADQQAGELRPFVMQLLAAAPSRRFG
ncbi:MAG: hypothetical protein ACE5GE_15935 [Phycisphaerae bacterium]